MTYFLSFESTKTILITSISVVGISCFIISIMLPIVFKYGVEKGRILLYVVAAIPTVFIVGGSKLLAKLNITIPTISQVRPYLYYLPAIILALLYISYKVSITIYEKREF